MATDTVTTNADTGAGSLRAVLASAAAGDTINFLPTVTNITLASTLTITKNVTIEGGNGTGSAGVTINGNGGNFSDFTINAGTADAFDGLIITGSRVTGAAGVNASGSTAATEHGQNIGGAITLAGTLMLSNSTISNNIATGGMGGTGSGNAGGGGGGSAAGGIYVAQGARLNLVQATNTFGGNIARGGDGGGSASYAAGYTGGYAKSPSNTAGGASSLGRPSGNGQTGGLQGNYLLTPGRGDGGNAFSDYGGAGTVATVTCYVTGTLIRTARGDVVVENVVAGDVLVTAFGETRPVLWMGRQTVVSAFADPIRSYPIRIAAGAIDDAVPARDLFLSPDHALMIDGFLVQAGALVNGSTVTQVTNPEARFTYYHIETADHAVILAEGAPAETFVSNVTRRTFDNYAEWEALFGDEYDAEPLEELSLARAMSHRQVPHEVRARMAARAAVLGADRSVAA